MPNHPDQTARFRNRAEEIEAVQWTGSNADVLRAFCGPDFDEIELDDRTEDPDETAAVRESKHGTWRGLKPGDWVVRLDGGLYEFAAADFAEQYEPAVRVPATDRTALREQVAAALREHYLHTSRDEADADGNLPCRCGDWREPGAEADDENDWDSHLAAVALAVVLPEPASRDTPESGPALRPTVAPTTSVTVTEYGLRSAADEPLVYSIGATTRAAAEVAAAEHGLRLVQRTVTTAPWKDAATTAVEPAVVSGRAADETQAADLPARLEAALTERFTALGNPFSEMRRHEKGPDGWPASHPVGPHQVAEVLRELLAQPAVGGAQQQEADRG